MLILLAINLGTQSAFGISHAQGRARGVLVSRAFTVNFHQISAWSRIFGQVDWREVCRGIIHKGESPILQSSERMSLCLYIPAFS